MTLKINRLLLILVWFLNGCGQSYKPVQKAGENKLETPTISDKDVKVPRKLIKDIEALYLKTLENKDIKLEIPRKYMSFKVFFTPTENKLAFNQTVEIDFPRGGGHVDLSKIVSGSSGSFYLNMFIDWEELGFKKNEVNEFQTYFISNSKKRSINQEPWGSGCDSYFNTTNMFHNLLSKSGLLLNATDARYLSVLAGTFVFVIIKNKDLYLSTITFSDSRYSDRICRS